jgi:glutamate formiminotransferase/formiminotetrahydrofolate cyclodeaminase
MIAEGMQTSLSDAGVGILCARTAVIGAYFNVRINAKDIKDSVYAEEILKKAKTVYNKTIQIENEVMEFIDSKM